ncbi:MAG TPA: ABC transporter substrate-binding protein [Anaeromyxobacter sp.]|nr:ABC transporter substrate-binding protein [Anaeromyxobacter sp.]
MRLVSVASASLVALLASSSASAQAPAPAQPAAAAPFKIGIVTFLSGGAAGPFGVPARNGAETVVEALNAGKLPAPYATKGLGGRPIEVVFVDEAGGTTKQVEVYRDLVQRQNVDAVIGYISSGDCLAVAPVAEELKKLTLFFDCGTPRIFEDAAYRWVFRTAAHAAMDNVAAALYATEKLPKLKKVAGINQNYAWGQDSWADFEASIRVLRPGVTIATSQMPKLLSGQYGAEISALLGAQADVIHSSFWGGDLDALILQGGPRGLFKKSVALLTAGETATHKLGAQIPDGTIIGARGPHGAYAPANELNKWFRAAYEDRYSLSPNYPAYHMAQALLGLKSAYEKAGKDPSADQIAAALEKLEFDSPSGKIRMALGKGHQAVEPTVYGRTKLVKGKLTFTDVKQFPAEKVNPPEGVKSADWIKAGFKASM